MSNILRDGIWVTKKIYEVAELAHFENLAKSNPVTIDTGAIKSIEKKVVEFEKSVDAILKHLNSLDRRVLSLEQNLRNLKQPKLVHPIQLCPPKPSTLPKIDEEYADDGVDGEDADDGVDLFAYESDEEQSEAAAKTREAVAVPVYAAKKSNELVLIPMSSAILDIKPWDNKTDMRAMEENLRKIEADGLSWGAANLVPLANGIRKLQISCFVEDRKISIDRLTKILREREDYIQSVDIAAFNKI